MQPAKEISTVVGALTILGFLLASCAPPMPAAVPKADAALSKADTPVSAPTLDPSLLSRTPKPTAEEPKVGGTLLVADLYEQSEYDIHQGLSVGVQTPLGSIFNGLLQFDALGDPRTMVGDLAESWDVSPDGKAFTFRLHKNVKWHDGTPLTPDDIKFSINRQANPPKGMTSPRQAWFEGLDRIEAIDANTVRIALKYPRAAFLPFLAAGWSKVLAKHVVEPLGDAKSMKAQVGTGPFKFRRYDSGVVFEVVKNPDYFVKGRPYLDGITRFYIKDDATRFAAFRTHRINMASYITMGFTTAQAELVEKELAGKARVFRFHGMTLTILAMNTKTAPFDDVRVRKAVALALDRPKAKGATIDEFRIGGFLPPGGKWALPEDELLKMPGYRQPKDADRAEARKLLAEAGYPDGLKVKLLNRRTLSTEMRTQFVQDQLRTVGVQLDLGGTDQAQFYADLLNHRFALAAIGEGHGTDDPDAWFTSVMHTKGTRNYAQFSDREVDELLEKQSRVMDEKERRELVLKAQRRVMELAPAVEVYWNWGLTGSWNELRNWEPGIGYLDRTMFQDVWLAK